MIWVTWDEEWILELADVAIYNVEHYQRIHEMLRSNVTVKIVIKDKKLEEGYVPSSSIFVIFVKKEVTLITVLDYKKEFG